MVVAQFRRDGDCQGLNMEVERGHHDHRQPEVALWMMNVEVVIGTGLEVEAVV